jgi:hypothetical protein
MVIELRRMICHRVVTTSQAFSKRMPAECEAVGREEAGIWIESQRRDSPVALAFLRSQGSYQDHRGSFEASGIADPSLCPQRPHRFEACGDPHRSPADEERQCLP